MKDTLKFRLPPEDLEGLAKIAKEERTTRASIARRAIAKEIREWEKTLDKT